MDEEIGEIPEPIEVSKWRKTERKLFKQNLNQDNSIES